MFASYFICGSGDVIGRSFETGDGRVGAGADGGSGSPTARRIAAISSC